MYITYYELTRRYAAIATMFDTEAAVNSDCIYYAEHELNGRLAPAFSVPFSEAHPTVKDLAMDLAWWKALATRDPKKAEEIKDAVLGRIERIKEGREYIYKADGTILMPESAGDEVWSTTMGYHPVHSMLPPEENAVDPDRLDDEESERE